MFQSKQIKEKDLNFNDYRYLDVANDFCLQNVLTPAGIGNRVTTIQKKISSKNRVLTTSG